MWAVGSKQTNRPFEPLRHLPATRGGGHVTNDCQKNEEHEVFNKDGLYGPVSFGGGGGGGASNTAEEVCCLCAGAVVGATAGLAAGPIGGIVGGIT